MKPPRRIAFSHAFSELLVVKSVRAYADGRALELGGLELIHGTTQNGDLAHQLAEVSAWIDQGVDAIVVMPIDADALQPLLERAQSQGIRFLSYAFPLQGSDGAAGFDAVACEPSYPSPRRCWAYHGLHRGCCLCSDHHRLAVRPGLLAP